MVCPTVAPFQPASLGSTPAAPRPVDKCLPSSPAPVPQATALLLAARCAAPFRRPLRLPRRSGVPPARLPPIRPLATPCRSTNRIESSGIPSLSHVAPSGVSERYPELLGFHQSPCPCLLVAPLSNQGPFPPPALPGFSGTPGLSATPPAQAGPRGFPVGACAPPTGLPVLLLSPSCTHAATTTPAEPVGARVARFPTAVSLPRISGGSASALPVSRPARRSLALRPARSLSRPRRPFVIEVLQSSSLPPWTAPTASGWSDSCRAGFAPAGTQRLSTAHANSRLIPFPVWIYWLFWALVKCNV